MLHVPLPTPFASGNPRVALLILHYATLEGAHENGDNISLAVLWLMSLPRALRMAVAESKDVRSLLPTTAVFVYCIINQYPLT